DPCDVQSNPQGFIALCVAENKLILDMLAERFMQVGTATSSFSDSSVYCYNSFLGMPIAREAVAYFLARRFLFPDRPNLPPDEALQHIRPNNVGIGSGAAAMLNQLFFLLGEAGEGCLIPAPYYAAFENDMNLVAGVVPFGIPQENPILGPSDDEMEAAFLQAKAKGISPKFLLLTNPNNPLATIYQPSAVARMISWARNRNMHTIVDEIYALSMHKGHGFQSVLQILDNDLGSDVHMVWAVSKDFGGSGLRVGVVYSQNEIFMEGLATSNIFSGVSGPMQYLMCEILTDDAFVDRFLEESRTRVIQSYRICTAKLEEMVLPFVPAEAGLFVYVDFSSLLPEKTFEWERKLGELMFEYAHLVLTPGASQRETRPGMFRICYAWVHPSILEVAMERLSRLVAKVRRMDWSDLQSRSLSSVLE
ncbi:1-aminocyclopropane-1-carboxylate synthase, partial [Phaeodactylum tricornutum CCAP 1055/1]